MMDEAADDQLADVMRSLRAAYLDEAPERVRELSAALGRLRLRDRSALEEIQRYFHRLAGSGGSYGFPDVTTTSRAAEVDVRQIIESGRDLVRADFETIEAAIFSLSSAFTAARQDFERGISRD